MSTTPPAAGQRFRAQDGTIYLIEDCSSIPPEDGDPATYMVYVVNADDVDDMQAMGLELLEDEWLEFVSDQQLTPA